MNSATFLSLPLVIGLAWTGGTMIERLDNKPRSVPEPCTMRFNMADRGAMLALDVPCRVIPQIQTDTVIVKHHPMKKFYDRGLPEEEPELPVAVRPEFPSPVQVSETEKIDVVEPTRTSPGCKPGRTRNHRGKCGMWR